MPGDQGEVGAQAAQRLVEPLGMAPQVDEHVLDDVLRGRRVAQDLPRRRMHGRPELVERFGEGTLVSGREPSGEQGAGPLHGADRTAAHPRATPAARGGSTMHDPPDPDCWHIPDASPPGPPDHRVLGDPGAARAAHRSRPTGPHSTRRFDMAVIAEVTLRGISREQYDAVRERTGWLG